MTFARSTRFKKSLKDKNDNLWNGDQEMVEMESLKHKNQQNETSNSNTHSTTPTSSSEYSTDTNTHSTAATKNNDNIDQDQTQQKQQESLDNFLKIFKSYSANDGKNKLLWYKGASLFIPQINSFLTSI